VGDLRISAKHARIERSFAGWQFQDLGSRNGFYVNGRGQRAPLPDGSVIRIGDSVMVFRTAPLPTDLRVDSPVFPGVSPEASNVRRRIDEFAASFGHVLILGDTGTGKESVAKGIGAQRAPRPFVTLNCAQLNREMARSELFGHVRRRGCRRRLRRICRRAPIRPATRSSRCSSRPATGCGPRRSCSRSIASCSIGYARHTTSTRTTIATVTDLIPRTTDRPRLHARRHVVRQLADQRVPRVTASAPACDVRGPDDRDVLRHAQTARPATLVEHLGEIELPDHGSTASNNAWTTSPTASANAWPTRRPASPRWDFASLGDVVQ
jgi:hypothetical protein